MNIYAILIPSILLFGYLLELVTETLNVKAASPTLPEEFKEYYDDAKYAKNQSYLKVNTKLSVVISSLDITILLTLIYTGTFNLIDNFLRSFGYGQIITAISFGVVLLVASKIIHLPFSIYDTFVIEQRYGFNRTTPKVFILDLIRGLVLSIILGGAAIAVIIWFFDYFGKSGWLYIWAILTIFGLFLTFIAPVVFMPMFNKFIPLEEGDLRSKIEHYAKEQNFKLKGIYKMDGSKRSTKANAFFTGFGKFKRIVLFDTLIEKLSEEQILAVLAHEMGHFKLKHVIKGMVISVINSGFMLFIFSLFLNNEGLISAFGFENVSIYAGLLAFGILFSPISLITSTFGVYLSRKYEYQADKFTIETRKNSKHLIDGLKKLTADSLSNLTPHPLKVFLEYSHPPILKRIKAMAATKK
ncbi:MAG TPA: M48 family metallopeptidase [Elusimicrobiales bacterium]|nr:M48 family metallopeptidase [Elusimicrobiales bacterium]